MSPGELIEPGYNTEASDRNIAREAQNINDENDHATTRKAPVSPGELTEPGYNGEVSLKSAYKKPLANSLADVERNVVSGESAQITPNEDARLAPNNRSIEVADRQLADNFTGATNDYSVANNSRNVNEDVKYKLNPEHEAQVRAYNEHITRLRQREEYLRGQGMSENAPAMISLRKAQEQAIYARDHIGEVDENGLKYKLSPEQEAFFKDSKIRDENGNLKTVYHGTDAEFDVFNPNNTSSNKWGAGNYLAFDENAGKNYGKNVKEMYANITSPISDKQKTISFDQYDALHRRVNNGEPAYREDYDMYDNDMDLLWDITDNGQWKKYAQDIKDTTGKDGVIMDDMAITFSPNQTKYTNNLNPTDSPDMRYKLGAKMQELASQNKLLARHLQLTGDENLVFNEWQNEMQKRALGYYDPKTDQINLNKLTEDTLNHELGHKLLTRVENKQDLLNSIRESYGDDYLINKYGSQYGNDLNLLAEEQLADGFSDYYNGRLNGEDKVRLGARLGIPQKVLAIYDRITEAVMGLVGKQDAIKQFYAQMETGKFRGVSQVSARATKPQPAYRIDPNTNIVHLDEGYSIPPDTRTGDIGRIIRGRIRQFINQDFDLGESGIQARVTSDTINEVSNKQPSMRHWQFVKKGEMSNNFNELLNAMQNVRVEEMNPAKANQKGKIRRNADYYIKGDVIVDVGGDLYEATIVNEVDKLGNVLAYDISGIRKSTGRGLDSSAISADALDQSIDNSSIANNPQNANDQ